MFCNYIIFSLNSQDVSSLNWWLQYWCVYENELYIFFHFGSCLESLGTEGHNNVRFWRWRGLYISLPFLYYIIVNQCCSYPPEDWSSVNCLIGLQQKMYIKNRNSCLPKFLDKQRFIKRINLCNILSLFQGIGSLYKTSAHNCRHLL